MSDVLPGAEAWSAPGRPHGVDYDKDLVVERSVEFALRVTSGLRA